MKRHKGLYPQVWSFQNLLRAAEAAQRGKRYRGDVADFHVNLEGELLRLQEELATKTYCPGPYRTFTITDPKERLISAAPYRDRVVHHALCQVIEPIFDPTFIYDSYACRPGKGQHAACDRFQSFCRQNRYVLKCDLQKYFPSIDHEILLAAIERKIGCPDTLWLIERIVAHSNPQPEVCFYYPGDDLFTPLTRRRGIPIGNLTSQFFANIYLNGFDHFVKEELRCRFYLRYVDDFVVLDQDKKRLHEVKRAMEETLASLRLRIHPKKWRIFPVETGTDFLGYGIWPDHRRLRRSNAWRFTRRLALLKGAYQQGRLTKGQVNQSIQSWLGHARHADTYRLRQAIFNRVGFGPVG